MTARGSSAVMSGSPFFHWRIVRPVRYGGESGLFEYVCSLWD